MTNERSLTAVFEARFEPTHIAASGARGQLRSYLDEYGIEPGLADGIELAASELLSNAVEQRPAKPVGIELGIDGTAVYLTVTNHRPAGSLVDLPIEIAAADDDAADDDDTPAEGGRGLAIVQALADGMWLHGGQTSTSISCLHKRGG